MLNGIMLLSLAVAPGFAAALFQRGLATDNQAALFNITANTPETITIERSSYAGETVSSTAIPARGFAPADCLLDNVGEVFTLANGTCAQMGQDPTTGNCDDANPGVTCLNAGTAISLRPHHGFGYVAYG